MGYFTANAIRSTMGEHVLQDWGANVLPVLSEALGSDAAAKLTQDPDPRHISNVVRYVLLYRFGGLWLDHDVLPLMDMRSPSDRHPWTAGFRAPRYSREGCAMFFPEPGHPMLVDLLNASMEEPELEEIRTGGSAATRVVPRRLLTSPARSGSHVLTEVGQRYPTVRIEDTVLPYDSKGRLVNRRRPMAVHLWEGSRP